MNWAAWLAVVVVVGLVALQVAPLVLARRVRGRRVPELEPFLSPEQRSARRLLVYFWSPSCARCHVMSKAIDELGSRAVVKIDVTGALPLAQAFHVMGTPTVAVVEGGAIRSVLVGVRSRAALEALLTTPAGP
ncbi:MAG: thioredoxin family protein [Myxococcaceae bacterium]|jgi:thiol-disulfide isomerase/thioredoxin|nr:thioredoxin family protein [Myxococcaceae bacterium]